MFARAYSEVGGLTMDDCTPAYSDNKTCGDNEENIGFSMNHCSDSMSVMSGRGLWEDQPYYLQQGVSKKG